MVAVVTVAGMAVAMVVIMVADTVVDMGVGTRMAAGIMAGLALRQALDMADRTSVRYAMRPFARRISTTRSICIQAPSATVV
ncbi:hypothetical protein ACFPFP_16150 [Bradyrhizobium sp. GCM10023182]|uniref:ABC transmembrane type-1 domain-containing protein n=1 Tax=Bradyrhizobium zhengyangense TaxID=2911009 RepID=A0ABS9LN95_9BRAD|nr:hypothetical protein [Bradyrhizobium zhengyangense]MCG2668481.1 hypothetical protein [Bradyrhizobium zhengyangense]